MSIEKLIDSLGTITDNDRLTVSRGCDAGDYANAYETEDWNIAAKKVLHNSTFYQMAFLIGFYGSYELHEIHDEKRRDMVETYREVFRRVFPEIAVD